MDAPFLLCHDILLCITTPSCSSNGSFSFATDSTLAEVLLHRTDLAVTKLGRRMKKVAKLVDLHRLESIWDSILVLHKVKMHCLGQNGNCQRGGWLEKREAGVPLHHISAVGEHLTRGWCEGGREAEVSVGHSRTRHRQPDITKGREEGPERRGPVPVPSRAPPPMNQHHGSKQRSGEKKAAGICIALPACDTEVDEQVSQEDAPSFPRRTCIATQRTSFL